MVYLALETIHDIGVINMNDDINVFAWEVACKLKENMINKNFNDNQISYILQDIIFHFENNFGE